MFLKFFLHLTYYPKHLPESLEIGCATLNALMENHSLKKYVFYTVQARYILNILIGEAAFILINP